MIDEDDETPDDSDLDDDAASVDTRSCPHCRRQVYEHAEMCPHCRNYISTESHPARQPTWIVVTAIAALAAILFFWVRHRV